MTIESIAVPINAARVCQAIAKIGYSPSAALKDIIDNSISAGASNILVELYLTEGKTISNRNNVERFVIIDDGCGMDDNGIREAFELGVSRSYSEDSLSKYGLGLKSAGLSLGDRISVVSKKEGRITKRYSLDYEIIKEKNEYVIQSMEATEHDLLLIEQYVGLSESGTIVTIDKCSYEKQDSMRKIVNELSRELGVVYYGFLTHPHTPLKITLRQVSSKIEDFYIDPYDILFLDKASSEYDPDNYDYVTPCKVLDDTIVLEGVSAPIHIQAVAFPKDKMKNFAVLEQGEREQIRSYRISRENMGFFIYRNGRLIKWGDRVRTSDNSYLIDKDSYGFRVKLSLTTAHDDALHVDVSKQRISIPEELEKALKMLLRDPLATSRNIFKQCEDAVTLEQDDREDGAMFSFSSQDLGEEDPSVYMEPVDISTVKRREEKLIDRTVQETAEDENDILDVDDEKVFKKIRYTSSVMGNRLFSIGYNSDEGTFIRVNQNHYFYFTILSKMPPNSPYKQIIEAMMFCNGIAERFTYTNVSGLEDEVIERVLQKLAELYSIHLDKWCQLNAGILEAVDE